eukprot:INCI11119.1.p1 GENE.INCI11119.1~~INCI11119.1.p1  ORF type:complete len:264 (+),score=56.10 INCI11119.1:117-794(+)
MPASALKLVAAALMASAATVANADCAPVKPVDTVDFDEWVRKTWYIQQQQVTEYLPEENDFCVLATYGDEQEKVPGFDGKVIAVHNYANEGKVNGPNQNAKDQILCARKPHNDSTALLVAPCFLPNVLAGDYWIVAVGDNGNTTDPEYTWAAVSGGQPTVEYPDGCTTKTTGINEAGLWIFTREPVGAPADIAAAQDALKSMGFTLSQLNNVTQEGCEYAGAKLK